MLKLLGYLKEEINSHDCGILNLGFFVAGANEFSISQQSDIFHVFSKHRIHNCIIVSQEHYVIDKVYNKSIKVN
jgi:hypothetical protein